MMRVLVRVLLALLSAVVLICAAVVFWFFFCSGDLPDIKGMARYAPNQVSRVSDPCIDNDVVAIRYEAIGDNLRAALIAAEGHERRGYAGLTLQISRTMFCAPTREIEGQLKEIRVMTHLERRFSHDQLLAIYANRVWFGEDCTGVEAAAQHYFHKEPNQLDIAEAALLAGLIQSPSHLSPYKHPDRAMQRRNQVIDAVVQDRAISFEQGEAAKATGLGLASS